MLKLRSLGYDLGKVVPESRVDDETYAEIFSQSVEEYGNKPLMDFETMFRQLEEWRLKYYTCHVPRSPQKLTHFYAAAVI